MQFLGPALKGIKAKGETNLLLGSNLSGRNLSGSWKMQGFRCAAKAAIIMFVPFGTLTPSKIHFHH